MDNLYSAHQETHLEVLPIHLCAVLKVCFEQIVEQTLRTLW